MMVMSKYPWQMGLISLGYGIVHHWIFSLKLEDLKKKKLQLNILNSSEANEVRLNYAPNSKLRRCS